MSNLERIASELKEPASGLEPETYLGADAARLTRVAAQAERLCATIKLLFAKRAAETRGWAASSPAASSDQWLAQVSGCSEVAARAALATAERIAELPATAAKLRDGSLSLEQAALVSAGAEADPAAEPGLLRIAGRGEMRNLRAEQQRVIAAVTDADEAQARAHRERHLRTWTRGMETHGAFSGPTTEVHRLLDALEPLRKEAFEAARRAGNRESQDAYRFDALIGLASGISTETQQPVGRVRVDVTALLRGRTEAGEVCEIPGVGPVPVAHAREVLSHGLLELVLHDGKDVHAIVTRTRHVPEALKIAIQERDQHCKVQGCDATEHLERHHTDAFAEHGITSYRVLGNLCPAHHDLVTYDGYTIETHDDGTWTLHPPATSTAEQRDTDAA